MQLNEEEFETQIYHVLTASFHISAYEVTQEEWIAIMDTNPSTPVCLKCPVNNITWYDAQEFIEILNEITDTTVRKYRKYWKNFITH